jgi:NAD-dependent DNA ligase
MSSKPLGGLHFVITGEFGEDRASIIKKLVSLGAVQHSGITAKTNLLIVGTAPGETKLRLAHPMGIPTTDRDWLVRALALGKYTLGDARIKVENV